MNETLVTLKMDGNKFGRVGGLALAGALQVNTTLEELDITNTEQVCQKMFESIEFPKTIYLYNMFFKKWKKNFKLHIFYFICNFTWINFLLTTIELTNGLNP